VPLETLRVERPDLSLGPDGKTLVTGPRAPARRRLALDPARAGIDWVAPHPRGASRLRGGRRGVRRCRRAGALEPEVDWLVTGAGAFEVGGPEATTACRARSSSRRRYGSAVRSGGGRTFGKDPAQGGPAGPGPRAADGDEAVCRGSAKEATVWLAYRPGDLAPRWIEVVTVPDDAESEDSKFNFWSAAYDGYRARMIAAAAPPVTAARQRRLPAHLPA